MHLSNAPTLAVPPALLDGLGCPQQWHLGWEEPWWQQEPSSIFKDYWWAGGAGLVQTGVSRQSRKHRGCFASVQEVQQEKTSCFINSSFIFQWKVLWVCCWCWGKSIILQENLAGDSWYLQISIFPQPSSSGTLPKDRESSTSHSAVLSGIINWGVGGRLAK